jgi:NAD(P)H-dependent flavin oxidoreductase YrpB (nitropropane dioxygenase family)
VVALTTPLCGKLGIRFPIIQAPIGSASTPELVAAVTNAGGLGMLSLTWTPLDEVEEKIKQVQRLTAGPFGVNLVLAFDIAKKLDTCLAMDVPIISTFWGDPQKLTSKIHAAGSMHLHSVGTASEARSAVDSGVDVIVAQGWESGGHVWGQVATLPLVPSVVDAVSPVPVIGAGGIADGRGLAAVLTLGAQAAWIGTRFLVAEEANVHASYRQAVLSASGEDATYTLCFADGWPSAPHRALWNSTLAEWEQAGRPSPPHRPGEGDIVAEDRLGGRHFRYEDTMPLPGMTGNLEALAMYAGQSAGIVRKSTPAAAVVDEIWAEAEQSLQQLTR